MPASTLYGYDLECCLGIGRQAQAGRWDDPAARWDATVWDQPDTTLGDWVDVTCHIPDTVRFEAGSDASIGVVVQWEAATCAFQLAGDTWDPWTGPYAGVVGPQTPVRWRWRESSLVPGPPGPVDGVNLATNPAFESGTLAGGWFSNNPALYPLAVDTAAPIGGTTSAMCTRAANPADGAAASIAAGSGVGARFPCTAGTPITAAVDFRAERGPRKAEMYFQYFNAAGTSLGVGGRGFTITNTVAGQTYRVSRTDTPVASAAFCSLVVNVYTMSGLATAGERVWFDNLRVGGSATDTAYFDGDTPDTPTRSYEWTGTPKASTSQTRPGSMAARPWEPLFWGAVQDGGWQWDARQLVASVACTDPTADLAAFTGDARPWHGAGDTAAARVGRILDMTRWPASARDITPGGVPLVATELAGEALGQLQEVADTDLALMWVRRDGRLAYRPQGRVNPGTPGGRLVVCVEDPDDLAVVDLGGADFSPLANSAAVRGGTVPATVDGTEDYVPPYVVAVDEGSISRFRARQAKLDLLHDTAARPDWSGLVASMIVAGQAWPSMAPHDATLGIVSGDLRVPGVLFSLEPDTTFHVVDTGGRVWVCSVAGWDVDVSFWDCSGVLHLSDITATTGGMWDAARWDYERWGLGEVS